MPYFGCEEAKLSRARNVTASAPRLGPWCLNQEDATEEDAHHALVPWQSVEI